ncbi:MAG: 2-oxoacid:acceptor oxidoreductase family protein [Armatimonadota bacterium]
MGNATQRRQPVHHELIVAGFGGQGVLKLGQILAEAALSEGYEVAWTPAYGPEMRGGPAFCTVVLSSTPIGSPVVARPDTAIILDRMSLQKYQAQLRPGGMLLLNSSLVPPVGLRDDITAFAVRANHLAEQIGDARIANMVMLGAFLHLTGLVAPVSVIQALSNALPERHRHLLPLNEKALAAGSERILEVTAAAR